MGDVFGFTWSDVVFLFCRNRVGSSESYVRKLNPMLENTQSWYCNRETRKTPPRIEERHEKPGTKQEEV